MNQHNNIPTIFTIFGVTGDLSKYKLVPALFDLFVRDLLPDKFFIIGFSRKSWSQKQFKHFISKSIEKKGHSHPTKYIQQFLRKCYYVPGLFEEERDFDIVSDLISQQEEVFGQCTNKLYYCAVPPRLYADILKNLKVNKLHKPCSDKTGWSRILIEKPFGYDIDSAQNLNKLLTSIFQEEQIYRIDHYLEKEMVENILFFRFANTIFEPLWSHNYIERVHIQLCERKGIGQRGNFYDSVGALRDIGQNHVLQMLAVIALEQPELYTADQLQKARYDVFKRLQLYTRATIKGAVSRGQYVGYKKEKNIKPKSQTETYFKINALINSPRWKGVPFILEGGKGLDKDRVKITVYFKKLSHCFCEQKDVRSNILEFDIQPEEKINLRFNVLVPGIEELVGSRNLMMSSLREQGHVMPPDPYEKVLYDCIIGDRTLFPTNKEEEATWKFITSILNNWEHINLKMYKKGSKEIT